MINRHIRIRTRIRSNSGNLAELPVAMGLCLLFFIFPLIDLVAIASNLAVIALIDNQAATRASSQPTYNIALAGAEQEVQTLNSSPFAKFSNIKPIGGYESSGLNLYVDATNYYNSTSSTYAANTPLPAGTDLTNNIFEYRADVDYKMQPFISLKSVPFIGTVPGLGNPINLHFETRRAVEHPEGLTGAATSSGAYSGGASTVNLGAQSGINTPGSLDDGTGSGWNYPNIYALIAAQGQTVVAQDVITVMADNPAWTPTGLTVTPGCKVWLDSRANGAWTYRTNGSPNLSANGDPSLTNKTGFPTGSLLGQVGGSEFELGAEKWNYPPPATGQLSVAMNDDSGPGFPPGSSTPSGYVGNVGYQIVRIIITE